MKKRILIGSTLLLLILSALFAINKSKKYPTTDAVKTGDSSPITDKKSDIQNINLDYVKLQGIDDVFSIKRGIVYRGSETLSTSSLEYQRVIRLAYFDYWMKEDPVMYGETIDTPAFKKALALLDSMQRRIYAVSDTKTSVYAKSFLEDFSESSAEFNKFKDKPTEEGAFALLKSLARTRAAYKNEIISLRNRIEEINKTPYGDKMFSMLGGENFTSAKVVLKDLGTLNENINYLDAEIAARGKCLNDVSACRMPGLPIKKSEPHLGVIAKIQPEERLSLQHSGTLRGPYQIASKCWKNGDLNYVYLSVEDSNEGFTFTKYNLATKGYFAEISERHGSFDKFLYDKGVRAIPQDGATTYMCPDLEYKVHAASMDAFRSNNKLKIFSTINNSEDFKGLNYEIRQMIQDGAAAESSFFKSDKPSDNDFQNLKDRYWEAYSYLLTHDNNTLNPDDFLTAYLSIKENLIGYHMVLSEIAFYLNSYWRNDINLRDPGSVENIFIYMLKSNYSISFLTSSPDAYRNKLQLQYFDNPNPNDNGKTVFGILSYDDAVNKYGQETINKWKEIFYRYNRPDREKYYSNYLK